MNKGVLIGVIVLLVVGVFFLGYSLISSDTKIDDTEPAWIEGFIANEESEPVANPPASLTKCEYKNEIVYYLPSRCCDIPSSVYNGVKDFICSPEGGITGKGDGKCSDFFDERKNCEVIWEDSRSYP